jgi:hypothetical protein
MTQEQIKEVIDSFDSIYPVDPSTRAHPYFVNRSAIYAALVHHKVGTTTEIAKTLKNDRSIVSRSAIMHENNMKYLDGYEQAYTFADKLVEAKNGKYKALTEIAVLEPLVRELDELKRKIYDATP